MPRGSPPTPPISSTATPWWDPGPSQCASVPWSSAQGPARVQPLCFPEDLRFDKHALFPVESYFLVKFPASCNQKLQLFPSRGCFLQQSNTGCKACDKYVFNVNGMPGNFFLPVHAKLCRIRCSLFSCHILKASVCELLLQNTSLSQNNIVTIKSVAAFHTLYSIIVRFYSLMEPNQFLV